MGMFRYIHFDLQKRKNLQSKQFEAQETCTELCWTMDVWITVSLPTFFPELWIVKILQKDQRNARFLPR